jgi:sugar lactone lactonase YvrE
VDTAGLARTVADDVWFPNGMTITPDGTTLLLAETPACRISAFTIAPDGSLLDRRVHADLGEARPDGICLDAEGALWIASPGTCELLRVAEGGKVLASLTLPGGSPAQTCLLGGHDGRSLFVASTPSHDEQTCLATRAGRVFVQTVDVPAAAVN